MNSLTHSELLQVVRTLLDDLAEHDGLHRGRCGEPIDVWGGFVARACENTVTHVGSSGHGRCAEHAYVFDESGENYEALP